MNCIKKGAQGTALYIVPIRSDDNIYESLCVHQHHRQHNDHYRCALFPRQALMENRSARDSDKQYRPYAEHRIRYYCRNM